MRDHSFKIRLRHSASLIVLVLGIAVALDTIPAFAQSPYLPDIAEFDGRNGYAFPPSEVFNLKDGATIEFWVQCGWDSDPGFDPVILSNAGANGARYTIAVTGDRSALTLQAADNIASVPFDCTDPDMQHIAIAEFADAAAVMVNGRVVGTYDYGFSDLTSDGFWIASADGEQAPFTGAIAGLRLWDVALDRGDLVKYSVLDVFHAADPHPDRDALLAHSDFDNDTMEIFIPSDVAPLAQ